jgi:hypothetical protein
VWRSSWGTVRARHETRRGWTSMIELYHDAAMSGDDGRASMKQMVQEQSTGSYINADGYFHTSLPQHLFIHTWSARNHLALACSCAVA